MVRHFQRATNLRMSGTLDSATLSMMDRPRCGLQDSFSERSLRYKVMGEVDSYSYWWWELTYLKRYGVFTYWVNVPLIEQVTGVRSCWRTASITTPLTWARARPVWPSRAHSSTGATCHRWGSGSCSREEPTSNCPFTEKIKPVPFHSMAKVRTVLLAHAKH